MYSIADHEFMSRALSLARRGLYSTSPNPRVGCVLVRGNQIVGEGFHERAGLAHAEINALTTAGEAAAGATAYVTLEPCSHHGRTPPCIDALILARISRVVAAMEDPNPVVSGIGLANLKTAGIEIENGILEHEARELNRGFVSRMTRGRPWVTMKIAMSLDGKTALQSGASQWITGIDARRDGHRLRARSCAILTGIGTILDDDPQLTVRAIETVRQPLRVVVDSNLQLPMNARVLAGGKVVVFTAVEQRAKIEQIEHAGGRVIVIPNSAGKVDLTRMMEELALLETNEVLVEAGFRLNGSLLGEGLIDEMVVYVAPCVIGDKARALFNLPELSDLSHKRGLTIVEMRHVGEDLRITAKL